MTTSSGDSETLLDRARDLDEARALIAEAHALAEPALLRISGPAGIGKTAFLRHLVAEQRGGERALWFTPEPGEQWRPGAAVRQLPELRTRTDADEEELINALGPIFAECNVVCVDDLQWLDEISRRVIMALSRSGGHARVLLFGDRRDDAAELPAHRSIRLAPLRSKAAEKLVRGQYPRVPGGVVAEIVSAASGLPFALAFLAAQAQHTQTRSRSETDPSIVAAIERRMAHCTSPARETIRHAAFLDAPVDLVRVAKAMNLPVRDAARALTEVTDLVTVDDLQINFRHSAIADAVRTSVPDSVFYYSRLLDAFAADDVRPEVLAARLRCARGSGDHAVAASCALVLGRTLAAVGSLESALEHLEAALHHVGYPIPVTYAVEYAGVLLQLSRDDRAATFLREQIRFAIDRADSIAAAELLASFFSAALTLERFSELFILIDRVANMPNIGTDSEQRLRSVRLAALAFSGNLQEYDQVAASARRSWVDERPASFVAALRGNAEEARYSFDAYQAELRTEHARQAPTDRVLRGMIALFQKGTSALTELGDLGRRVRTHPSAAALRILCEVAAGRWDAARLIVEDVPLWDERYDEPYEIVDLRLLFAALTQQACEEPRRTVRTLRSMIARGQVRHAVSPARWYLVSCTAATPSSIADIITFVGDTLAIAPMPYLLGALPLSIALLQPRYGAAACAAALESWPYSNSPWHRAHRDLSVGLIARDNVRLRGARDAFDSLNAPAFSMIAGAALPVPRARDVALANSLKLEPRSVSLSALTARERDVSELAATGKTNREIAAALRITERTVEVHLTNAYKKLGVRSRSALAHYFMRN